MIFTPSPSTLCRSLAAEPLLFLLQVACCIMILGVIFLAIGWTLVGLFTFYLIYLYGHRSSLRWYHLITVYLGLFFSLSIVFLLPMDLSLSNYLDCQKGPNPDDCPVPLLHGLSSSLFYWSWRLIYWNAFFSTWLIMPFLRSFSASGEWGTLQRAKDAIKRNMIYYGVTLSCLFIFMFYLWTRTIIHTWHGIVALLMASSNAYGLFLIICFMSYGLIVTPKRLWMTAFPEDELKLLYKEAVQAKEELDDAKAEIQEMIEKIEEASHHIPNEHPLRILVDDLLSKLAQSMRAGGVEEERMSLRTILDQNAFHRATRKKYNGNDGLRAELVRLNRKLGKSLRLLDRSEGNYQRILSRSFYLQDILPEELSAKITCMYGTRLTLYQALVSKSQWIYYRYMYPWFFRVLAMVLALQSGSIIWSEMTLLSRPRQLSLIAVLMNWDALLIKGVYEILAFLTILYMCYCTFSSLMSLRVFSTYKLVPHQHTDVISLLFYTGYFCRLTFPLCYNYLNLIQYSDSSEANSQFSKIMGSINLIPFLGENYNLLVPLLMAIVVSAILLRLDQKMIRLLHLDTFFYLDTFRSEVSNTELTNEGHELVRYARSIEERKANGRLTRLAMNSDGQSLSSGSSLFQPFKGKYEPIINPANV